MSSGDRARQVARWLATRSPRTYLIAGWILFGLGSYPGYMSFDSSMQLYDVRSGNYSDVHSPVMTALWSLCEYVASGPFPMLALQSGLFLFGLAAISRTVLTPRAAAVTASLVLLFPPVYAPMAVIWRDSLLAGALLAATGALLQSQRGWKIAGIALAVVACSCRGEALFAILPLALVLVPDARWWKRALVALGVTVGLWGTAKLADWALTDTKTYTWSQALMTTDTIGTLRRAKVHDDEKLRQALAGLPIANPEALVERMGTGRDALNWWPLSHGDKRIFDLVTTDDQEDALAAAWRSAIGAHPGAYLVHRWAMGRSLLGIATPGGWSPVYDGFGDPALLEPLHHRASASDWQTGMQAFVRAGENTPLFKPWLYVALAIVAIVLLRRRSLLRNLAISGLAYELALFLLAPAGDYRFSHWLVTAVTAALAAAIALRRWQRSAE